MITKPYVIIYDKERGRICLTEQDWVIYFDEAVGITIHREDGPAEEWADGTKEWYIDGKRHREDGPALEYISGANHHFIDGKGYSENGYNKLIREVDSLDPVLGLIDPREWVRKRFSKKLKT